MSSFSARPVSADPTVHSVLSWMEAAIDPTVHFELSGVEGDVAPSRKKQAGKHRRFANKSHLWESRRWVADRTQRNFPLFDTLEEYANFCEEERERDDHVEMAEGWDEKGKEGTLASRGGPDNF